MASKSYKNQLQEWLEKRGHPKPVYEEYLDGNGEWVAKVQAKSHAFFGRGRTKTAAGEVAATRALEFLNKGEWKAQAFQLGEEEKVVYPQHHTVYGDHRVVYGAPTRNIELNQPSSRNLEDRVTQLEQILGVANPSMQASNGSKPRRDNAIEHLLMTRALEKEHARQTRDLLTLVNAIAPFEVSKKDLNRVLYRLESEGKVCMVRESDKPMWFRASTF